MPHRPAPIAPPTAPQTVSMRAAEGSRWRGPAAWVAGGLAACLLIGCAGGSPAQGETYAGPPLSSAIIAGEHVVVIQSPSPGWTVTLDRVEEALGRRDVMLTLREPNPAYLYPQVVVEQRVSTRVPLRIPIRVLMRVTDFEGKGGAYARALDVPAGGTPAVVSPATTTNP